MQKIEKLKKKVRFLHHLPAAAGTFMVQIMNLQVNRSGAQSGVRVRGEGRHGGRDRPLSPQVASSKKKKEKEKET